MFYWTVGLYNRLVNDVVVVVVVVVPGTWSSYGVIIASQAAEAAVFA